MRNEEINKFFDKTQFLNSQNTVFIAQMYQKYCENKAYVSQEWVEFFSNLSEEALQEFSIDFFGPSWKKRDLSVIEKNSTKESVPACKKTQGVNIEEIFIKYGHLIANIDPIFGKNSVSCEQIDNLTKNEPDAIELYNIYCKSVGAEFDHILNQNERDWLAVEFKNAIKSSVKEDEKLEIAKQLYKAQAFEEFLHKKYPGMKRFSLQGGESTLACLNEIVNFSSEIGYSDVVIGMPHRGRLNILSHIAGKPFEMIFSEFSKTLKPHESLGEISWDVKYHAGYKSRKKINGRDIDVQVAYNPSHLEAINPVVMGVSYAMKKAGKKPLPVLLHGDAAFIGQGVVSECFNMSGVDNYNSGGVFHIIVNNQIGFTAESFQSRSTRYCTDIAKMSECPIFHINGDDADSCVKITKLAIAYREKFKKDVVLDIICSRKYGHNEGDEPFYTNPVLYNALKDKKTTFEIYLDNNKSLSGEIEKFKAEYQSTLEVAYQMGQEAMYLKRDASNETKFSDKFDFSEVKTGFKSKEDSKNGIAKVYKVPSSFTPNNRLAKQLDERIESGKADKFDWAAGEILAFSSLVAQGFNVRLTGQDSERGTFSHRHSVLSDSKNGTKYNILSPFFTDKSSFEICNSPLSEYAVLGFEHGFSLVAQNDLTIWEAQFGDFANGANTIFDQFVSSCEKKWLQLSNLVMLLPHGFEGQGPEHSSARLERYLQACAQDNIIVANITTPANLFHALRRQVLAKYRKPLIIMSPKSLLRNPLAISSSEDFTKSFLPIIGEVRKISKDKVKKIVVTSGKIYYELLQSAIDKGLDDVAILRIEQYYPFDSSLFSSIISQYKNAKSMAWVQEEPKNMGAWSFIRDYLSEACEKVGVKLSCVSRIASASPGTGFEKIHKIEQELIIAKAFE